MRHFFVLSAAFLFSYCTAIGQQGSEYSLQNYHPVSPAAFQFLKYDALPVSEYTGIPNINIPLYQIEEDGVTVPLNLSYHSAGIRTNQEASSVGLGWDLNIGSIVQEINDVDDYDPTTVRQRPDYHYAPYPTFFFTKDPIPNCFSGYTTGWATPAPLEPTTYLEGWRLAKDYWIPVNEDFDNQYLGQQVLTSPYYDSEPDIFSANFCGHSVKFMRNPDANSNVIYILDKGLNGGGYRASKTTNGFLIKVPTGDEYYFELSNTTTSYSLTSYGNNGINPLPSSKIWYLTKIITKNKKQITFNYTQTAVVNNFPNYSEKWDQRVLSNAHDWVAGPGGKTLEGYSNLALSGLDQIFSYSSESRSYINSITFPKGSVTFSNSDRTDMLGAKKIDAIQVNSTGGDLVRSVQFNYSYYDATGVGGNTYSVSSVDYGNTALQRLKLLSINDNSGATHTFTYNSTSLPPKNSLSQDFWGYYNGQSSNTSIVPNPARLKITGLADNGNNNSSSLTYAQAGILTEIKYPTGGKINLEYELNQFDNYWVPDLTTINNTTSTGNGLRIHAINYQAVDGVNSKKTIYTYSGGKLIQPGNMYRQFNMTSILTLPNNTLEEQNYAIDELNAKGFFTINSLGSISGVGYDKVIRQEVNSIGSSLGRTETLFHNEADAINGGATPSQQFGAALPALKNPNTPENGVATTISLFDDQNRLVKKTENSYTVNTSNLFYGAKIFGYTTFFYIVPCTYVQDMHWTSVPENLIGYYPIYGVQSNLSQSTVTEYDNNNNTLVTQKSNSYDLFGQVNFIQTRSSTDGYLEEYFTNAYDHYLQTGDNSLVSANKYAEITNLVTKRRKSNYYQFTDQYKYDKTYTTVGSNIVVNQVTTNAHPGTGELPSVITYDNYDATNANLQQFTVKGTTNSLLWDYAGEYVTAEVANAAFSDVAATSFEADSKGNWTYAGTPITDAQAPTGKKVYPMSGGTISKTGLDAGKNYIVSYWSNAGVLNVNSSAYKTGRSLNGYTYYEHKVPTPAGGNIAVTGSGQVDELRLYPEKSQMKTYTYTPLVGLASQCDENNKINYYTYDYANRLSIVRDQDKNIIKKICYNYAGQVEDCVTGSSSTAQWRPTGNSRCQACPQNSNYISDVKEKEERDINPSSPTYNTLHWVVDPLEHCVPPPAWQSRPDLAYCEQNSNGINTGNLVTPVYDINPCSSSYGQPGISIVSLSPGCSPASCSTLNCLEPEYKCINGICTHGTWSIVRVSRSGLRDPVWTCIYAWCFPDGTTSTYTQTTTGSTACTVNCY